MSTEENKEVERRVFEEILTRHNLAVMDELIAAAWWYHVPGGEDVRGHDGFRQFHNMLFAAFPDLSVEIEDMIAEGDKVVVRCTVRGTHQGEFLGIPPTSKQCAFTAIAIHRIFGGKEVEVWDCADYLGLMQQLGVIPKQ